MRSLRRRRTKCVDETLWNPRHPTVVFSRRCLRVWCGSVCWEVCMSGIEAKTEEKHEEKKQQEAPSLSRPLSQHPLRARRRPGPPGADAPPAIETELEDAAKVLELIEAGVLPSDGPPPL